MSRILIIEDDESIARLEKDYLEINDYEVVIENTGDINKIKELSKECDLIILDIMLPKGNGKEICKELRKSENLDIPIIIISAKDTDKDIILGLGFGADDYLIKPFNPNELVARVKSHIKRYNRIKVTKDDNVEKSTIRIKNMEINELTNTLKINNEEVDVTATEFKIILLLANNRGRVFSKEDIYERIWKCDSFGDTSTVVVHIRKIREKIEKISPDEDYIETIWGVGYKIK